MAEKLTRKVRRQDIVEVGNLASLCRGAGQHLLTYLGAFLFHANKKWAVFTATAETRNLFYNMGAELHYLSSVSVEALKEHQNDWGTYYDREPQLVALDLLDFYELLLSKTQFINDNQKCWFMSSQQGLRFRDGLWEMNQ